MPSDEYVIMHPTLDLQKAYPAGLSAKVPTRPITAGNVQAGSLLRAKIKDKFYEYHKYES